MSASNEWIEFHLTPTGWVGGDSKNDFSPQVCKEIPADRVLTVRWEEYLANPCANMQRGYRAVWQSQVQNIIEELQTTFGKVPNSRA